MDFFSQVEQAHELLRRHGRVSLRGLMRQFDASREVVDEIAAELAVRGVARRDGDILVLVASRNPTAASQVPGVPEASAADAILDEHAEIRHVTVLFCDVVDSTAMSHEVDAERWTAAMRGFLERAADDVVGFGGWVSGFQGDGLTSFFGYPTAQEDAAERAVRAGLAIVGGIEAYADRAQALLGRPLQARVGIHSGPCVVNHFGGNVQIMGRTTNVAARIESAAPPNSVAISADTRRLVSGVFVLDDLGTHALKGAPEPMQISRVVSVGGATRRIDNRRINRGPLVGRTDELGDLLARWRLASAGEGQFVEVAGEAGIGKSRLVDALRDSIADEAVSWLDASCSPYARSAPLQPIVELQGRALAFDVDTPAALRRQALRNALAGVGLDADRGVDLLADLHRLDAETDHATARQPAEVFDLLIDWLLALGRRQPTVLLVEDVHWADPSTVELLSRLGARIAHEPILLLVTTRPELAPSWRRRSNFSSLPLGRVSRDQVVQIAALAVGAPLPDAVLETIATRSDGVPLFVEELALGAQRSDGSQSVPDTLQDMLLARLDVLGHVRDTVQVASVVGREFTVEDVCDITGADAREVTDHLERAVEDEVLFRRGAHPDAEYFFKHALLRDAVYESMVTRVRRAHHRRYADALVTTRAELAAARPDLVAEHYALAEDGLAASEWWERAARQAALTATASETQALYQRAIDAADPEDTERLLRLHLALAGTIGASAGWVNAAVAPVWDEIVRLTRGEEHGPERVLADTARASRRVVTCDFDAARQLVDAVRADALAHGVPEALTMLLQCDLVMLNFEGRPLDVVAHFGPDGELVVEPSNAFDPALGVNSHSLSHAWHSYSLALLGRFESSFAASRRAMELAQSSPHAQAATVTNLLTLRSTIHLLRGDMRGYLADSEAFLQSARRFGLDYFERMGWVTTEIARATLEPGPDVLARLDERIGRLSTAGNNLASPIFPWSLAGVQLACGEPRRALESAMLAARLAAQSGQHWYDPQILARRLRAQLALDEVPSDWDDEIAATRTFAHERGLLVGALQLAIVQADLAADGRERSAALDELRRAIAAIPEPSGAPIVVDAERRVAALVRGAQLNASSRSRT